MLGEKVPPFPLPKEPMQSLVSTEFKEEGETVSKQEQDHKLTEEQKETEEWVRPRGRNAAIWSHFKESKSDREIEEKFWYFCFSFVILKFGRKCEELGLGLKKMD